LPRRWVVERTLAWLNRNRRLAKDFEVSIASAKSVVRHCLGAAAHQAISLTLTQRLASPVATAPPLTLSVFTR
jgi:transposase